MPRLVNVVTAVPAALILFFFFYRVVCLLFRAECLCVCVCVCRRGVSLDPSLFHGDGGGDRSFPGWEMPLPAASASRAETSALDQQAAAMVDDLESSLAAFVPRRRASMAGAAAHETEAANGSRPTAAARSARAEGQGLVEPSLLVAANAGLGAAAALGQLLPLWDYLLVRHDKHFG